MGRFPWKVAALLSQVKQVFKETMEKDAMGEQSAATDSTGKLKPPKKDKKTKKKDKKHRRQERAASSKEEEPTTQDTTEELGETGSSAAEPKPDDASPREPLEPSEANSHMLADEVDWRTSDSDADNNAGEERRRLSYF